MNVRDFTICKRDTCAQIGSGGNVIRRDMLADHLLIAHGILNGIVHTSRIIAPVTVPKAGA